MTPHINEFNKLANAVITDATQRSRIIAAAVATAVAGQASLPTAPVDTPAIYFAGTVMQAAAKAVSSVNEKIIFDCKLAVEWARVLWLVRYGAAHPVAKPIFGTSHSFFESTMGVPRWWHRTPWRSSTPTRWPS
jgi:hypothetical protein